VLDFTRQFADVLQTFREEDAERYKVARYVNIGATSIYDQYEVSLSSVLVVMCFSVIWGQIKQCDSFSLHAKPHGSCTI
jgi:hypothetical protein